jgi:integrase
MSRGIQKLSALGVARATKIGLYGDGGNLFLRVGTGAAKSWVFRYMVAGQTHEAGLGSAITFSLKEARERARRYRQMLADGIDPIAQRQKKRDEQRLEAAKAMSFRQAAESFIKAKSSEWTNANHAAQWSSTLETYVYPIIGDLPVARIDTGLVLKVIEPIWAAKPETASRVRGRIGSVLDWATSREYRSGENPARWKGHLENSLPKVAKAKAKVRRETGRDEHHAALPYSEIAVFLAELRQQPGIAPRALEFLILTAARTREVLGAKWDEISRFHEAGLSNKIKGNDITVKDDLAAKLWTVPGDRMKAGNEHRVPMSDAALAIVGEMAAIRESDFVFPGGRAKRPLGKMAMMRVLARMGRSDLTVHGFRSTFSDWVAEQTNFPSEVREMALAHAVGDKVEAAYRRGDLFEKRRALASAWARYCSMPAGGGAVVPMRRSG